MKDDGLMMACPPCSLFGPACSSVHRRCWDNPYGNTKVFKVRLANRIFMSFVPWMPGVS